MTIAATWSARVYELHTSTYKGYPCLLRPRIGFRTSFEHWALVRDFHALVFEIASHPPWKKKKTYYIGKILAFSHRLHDFARMNLPEVWMRVPLMLANLFPGGRAAGPKI